MRRDIWFSGAAAAFAFLGTFIMVADRFECVHRNAWRNLAIAETDLDTFDTKDRDGKRIGKVEEGKPGFSKLVPTSLSSLGML